jgi:hypothetical protein
MVLVACCSGAATGGVHAHTLTVGPGKSYTNPSDAIRAADDGDTVVIDPGTYFDCAIVRANNLTIEGAQHDGSAILTDKTCQGKALLVIAGHDVTVRNLTLQRARVPDHNGAGIRTEGKNLTVDGVHFLNNEDGIMGGGPGSTVIVRNSEFLRNGACTGSCAHGIYVGNIDLLRVEHSRFFETKHAHHIKSRARRTEVLDSDIQDGPEGTASYLIDVSNGGSTVVKNCILEKGPHNENHTAAIRIGAEGVTQPTDEITIENNHFTNDGPPTIFVDNLTATEAVLKHNTMTGPITKLRGDGTTD